MITIGNGYIDGWDNGHYIGRGGKGKMGSALANPYHLKNQSDEAERAEVIAKYRRWLWQQIQCNNKAVMDELYLLKEKAILGNVHLLCFCKRPDRKVECHGDVIKNCIKWLIQEDE